MNENKHLTARRLAVGSAIVLGGAIATEALGQSAAVTRSGANVIFAIPTAEQQATSPADIANARPMPLLQLDAPDLGARVVPIPQRTVGPRSAPFVSRGAPGNGVQTPITLPAVNPDNVQPEDELVTAQEFGVATAVAPAPMPYTTNRVDTGTIVDALGNTFGNVSSTYPFSAVGKLYFVVPGTGPGTGNMVCTAALIKPGLVVTAAHCAAKFGGKTAGRHTNFQFVPATYNAAAPYGTWAGELAVIPATWVNGTDLCYARGVTCVNDVAVVRLVAQTTATGTVAFPGTATGWLNYGANGYGFTAQKTAQVAQLGYPASHDAGGIMQRTDSQGIVRPLYSNSTVWGSRQGPGSSGGPVIVNLGISGVLTGVTLGVAPLANTVIGVTSWEATPVTLKRQGASAFTTANIVTLVNTACGVVNGVATQPACL